MSQGLSQASQHLEFENLEVFWKEKVQILIRSSTFSLEFIQLKKLE